VAFGHSITTTPLHVALAYAAIANGGLLMKPRLITSITDTNGNVRVKRDPRVVRRVISEETSASVREMLRAVVSDGTGRIAAVHGYQIAGKTGTAQKYKKGAYVGSFIGFFPASPGVKPRAVILVAVDEPHGAYYGAEVAAPAFQAIASRLISYWHVPEDDPDATQYKLAVDGLRRSGEMPVVAVH
jgi:stage V sporulation protein D (sporulation-specific penicillin-binding protein)